MIDTDEKVDARTVEEDMETRNNMNWLNNRVVELETEVKRLRDLVEFAIAAIDSTHCYMGEDEQVDLRDYLKEGLE